MKDGHRSEDGISLNLLAHANNFQNHNSQKQKPNVDISKREIEILNLIAQGFTNSEIADKLFKMKTNVSPLQFRQAFN
ncbi:MAG: response regulator transcription factor [Hymenobacter sp.]|nr:MAG: response regulator transcription factor [Hymenobacter sp.]